MAYSTISALLASSALTGVELLEVSQLSTTVTISAGTISALASDNSFNDSGSGFVTAGFAAGDRVKVTGFTGNTANNIFVAEITALTAGKMTIGGTDGDVIVDDAAGETVTISKWITRRTTSQEIADLAKPYVDAQLAKIASRKVRVASTAAITLATGCENGDTIDGVTLATGDRVLLKNQAAGAENGIWVVAASGSPTRATDADSSDELVNVSVWVAEGTSNADTLWTCTTNAPITVGTTALTFSQFVAGGYSDENARDAIGAALVAGSNVTITVNDAGDQITIAASGGGGGGGGLVAIGSAVAAGGETSLSVSSIPSTYRNLIISISARGSAGAGIFTRFNGDSGANYDVLRQFGGASHGGDQNLSQTSINGFLMNMSASANIFAAGKIEVFSYAETDRHKAYVADAFHDAAGSFYTINAAGRWKSTSAINSVSILPSTGSFAAGSRLDVWALV